MTKENLIDLVQDYLAGGDMPQEIKGRFHDEIVAKHIALAMDYLVAKVLYPEAARNDNWGALDAYAKPFYNVPILYNEDRDEKYSIMPVQPISLPSNRGVRIVSSMKDQKNRFIYRDNNSNNIYGNLDVDSLDDTTRYYVENINLYYSEHINYKLMDKVLMKLIVPFDALDYEDDVNIPQGYGKLVLDLVLQSLLGKKLEKMSNDNNANIP